MTEKAAISLSQLCFITVIKHSSEVIFTHSCNKPTSASLSSTAHWSFLSAEQLYECVSECV